MSWGASPTARCAAALVACTILCLLSCSSDSGRSSGTTTDPLYLDLPLLYARTQTITVDVAYEPGAEPYTTAAESVSPCWSILRDNIEAAAGADNREVFVPESLSEMSRMAGQNMETWTTADIVDLARIMWDTPSSPEDVMVHVIFLKGIFEDEQGVNPRMLGISFGGTSLVAIFKDVVERSSPSPLIRRFVEQATLVHETGHILGLVNNGTPMASPHEDAEHPKHCANPVCVMYWSNEGSIDFLDYTDRVTTTGSLVLFCDDCLADCRAFGARP